MKVMFYLSKTSFFNKKQQNPTKNKQTNKPTISEVFEIRDFIDLLKLFKCLRL